MHIHFETLSSNPPTFQIKPEEIEEAFRRSALDAKAFSTSFGRDLADLGAWAQQAEALVAAFNVLTRPGFPLRSIRQAFPKLRWIHVTSAGIDKVLPLDWLPPDIVLTNSSGIHSRKSREYAFMSLTALNMKLPQIIANQSRKHWQQLYTPSIAGRSIAVIGLGALGSAAAQAAKSLGMTVLGVRRSDTPHPDIDLLFPFHRLNEALADADIVYVATPLTPETRGLIGKAAFAAMKPGAGIVNIGRAAIVDYDELALRLSSGQVSGAVLDVFDPEPLPPTSPLWTAPNLLITPHIGMDEAGDYILQALALFLDSMPAFLAGAPLPTAVDRTLGY